MRVSALGEEGGGRDGGTGRCAKHERQHDHVALCAVGAGARARVGDGGSPISGGISAQQGLMPCMLVVPGAVCSAAVFVISSRSTRVGTVLSLASRPRGVSVGGGAEP